MASLDEDDDDDEERGPPPIAWDIRLHGRAWTAEDFHARAPRLMGLDFEISGGKLLGSDSARLLILGMLLENLGTETAVRMGDLDRWREAIDALEKERTGSRR